MANSKDSNSDHILFIPTNIKSRNQNSFFLRKNANIEHCRYENNMIHLSSSNNDISYSLDESLPVELQDKKPMVVSISYDDTLFKQSEYIESKDDCFKILHSSIKSNCKLNTSNHQEDENKTDTDTSAYNNLYYYIIMLYGLVAPILKRLHWFMHLENNYKQIFHKTNNVNDTSRTNRINLYTSKVFDFLMGTITLYFLLKHREDIVATLLQSTKFIINALKDVLNTLMDSPAGLKLNYALNHTLAIFFFYHISLWRAFIQSIFTVSSNIVYVFAALGSFGMSYQIALCADLIMFLTFHVYCIYVYASRFYRVQIYTISSLWRLFIGRKHNPLKQRVDSFQYSHNQLFVGTLGFTVLLFLLPTTFLYYIVFSMFRLWVLVVCRCMSKLANFISTIPLYLIWLRLIGSSTIKGKVRLYLTKNELDSTIQLHASLEVSEHWFSKESLALTEDQPSRSFNEYINNLCIGKLL